MALVIELFGPDFRGVVGGSPEGSLLQHAAWVGDRGRSSRFAAGRGRRDRRRARLGRARLAGTRAPGPRLRRRRRAAGRGGRGHRAGPSWRRPTARSPSGSSTTPTLSPNADVIGPLAALRQGADRREEAARARPGRAPRSRARRRAGAAARRAAAAPPRARPPTRATARGAPARPRRSSTSVRSSRGSSTCPRARPPSSGSPPSSSVHGVDGTPDSDRARQPGGKDIDRAAAHDRQPTGAPSGLVMSAAIATSSRSAAAR